MCIDTRLFNENRSFIDFLKYLKKSSNEILEIKDGKVLAVCCEINIVSEVDLDIVCDNIIFKEIVKFQSCNFKGKAVFKNCTFEEGVYFNNSVFINYADFHECKFNKDVCLYGVTFKEVPNFSACYFKEPKTVNLIDIDIDALDFKKVENFITTNFSDKQYELESKHNSINQETIQLKHKLRYARNIKDSFRTIKDILITQNNALDAQKWHKLELYATEIETKVTLEKQHKSNKKKPFNQPKETNLIALTLDKVMLWLYRNTSIHHTNFARILNFSLCMIVMYAFMLWIFNLLTFYVDLFAVKSLVLLAIIGCVSYGIINSNTVFKNILILFLMIFGGIILVLSVYMPSVYADILFFTALYILSIVAIIPLYFKYIKQKSLASFLFHYALYFLLLIILVVCPQFIHPLIGNLLLDKPTESMLETKLNRLDSNVVINLAKILQKEFIAPYNYKDKQNIPFAERNATKSIIIANREELNNIISLLFDDKKTNNFKKILTTLNDNPIELPNVIKDIDDNNNSTIFYDMSKLLNMDFVNINIDYEILRDFPALSVKLQDEDYQIFALQENQSILKNILSLIILDNKLHLQEIKKVIDYDSITDGTIKTINMIYNIILLLCIFSLQKIARKNSIIPV